MTHTEAPAIDAAAGRRLASAISAIAGVERALVASLEGELMVAEPAMASPAEASRGAALATFVARRAEALSLDGDLRGMGRVLAASRLEHVAISSSAGEALLYAPGGFYLLVSLRRGSTPALTTTAIEQVLRRYI